ncbi:MAG: hypothetical protein OXI64_03920 [Defluviicoccus sp.]|nr:hypothetical protein [Defluviicoccus sp.]
MSRGRSIHAGRSWPCASDEDEERFKDTLKRIVPKKDCAPARK